MSGHVKVHENGFHLLGGRFLIEGSTDENRAIHPAAANKRTGETHKVTDETNKLTDG